MACCLPSLPDSTEPHLLPYKTQARIPYATSHQEELPQSSVSLAQVTGVLMPGRKQWQSSSVPKHGYPQRQPGACLLPAMPPLTYITTEIKTLVKDFPKTILILPPLKNSSHQLTKKNQLPSLKKAVASIIYSATTCCCSWVPFSLNLMVGTTENISTLPSVSLALHTKWVAVTLMVNENFPPDPLSQRLLTVCPISLGAFFP